MNDSQNRDDEQRDFLSDDEPMHKIHEAEVFDTLFTILIVAIAVLLAACWWLLPGGRA